MKLNKIMLCCFTGLVIIVLLATPGLAGTFRTVGARADGMGGSGVAATADEHAGLWNPAMQALKPGFAGGLQIGIEAQITNDFLDEIQDLQNFEDDFDKLDNIIDSGFSDTTAFAHFNRLIKELQDVNQPGQGLLIDITGGLNFAYDNWSISANNFSSLSGHTTFQLEDLMIGDITGDGQAIGREFIAGDPNSTTITDRTPTEYSEATVKLIEQRLKQSLDGDDFATVFGFDTGTTASSAARHIAWRLEKGGFAGDTVTDQILNSSSRLLIPGIVTIARGDTDSFDTENQQLILQGAMINEIALNYAHPEPVVELFGSPIYLGGTLNYLQGELARVEYLVFEDKDIGDEISDSLDEGPRKSSAFSLDLGAVWDGAKEHGLRAGLSGRYLNNPSFNFPEINGQTKKLRLKSQWRAGFSGYPLEWIYRLTDTDEQRFGRDWWQISVDYDLTRNRTLLPDYHTQYLAIGNEFNIFNRPWINFALRAGLRTNRAESREGKLYTVGLGIQLVRVNIDLSGTISDRKTRDEDGNKFPTVAGGSLNLSMRF